MPTVHAAKHYQMPITVKNEAVVLDRRANEKHRDSYNISDGSYLDYVYVQDVVPIEKLGLLKISFAKALKLKIQRLISN